MCCELKVTQEMVDAAYAVIRKAGYIIHHPPVIRKALEAALSVSVPGYTSGVAPKLSSESNNHIVDVLNRDSYN